MGLIRRGESAGTPLRFRTSGVRCLFSRACPPQLRDGDAGFRLTRARSFRGRGMPRPCIGESERCSWLRRALTPQVRDGDAGLQANPRPVVSWARHVSTLQVNSGR